MISAHILLVEDDPGISLALTEILEFVGYRVTSTGNGQEALAALATIHPDLIISDIVMPGMDGYQLLEAVRERPDWLDIPFIFLSGRDQKIEVRHGKQLGADDYLTKPFEKDDLLVAIESKLRRRDELERLNQRRAKSLKRTILNTLTHEFRTPLTYITAYLNLLDDIEGEDKLGPEELRNFMRGIRRGSERLSRLVEDFIFLVELETGEARAGYESRRHRVSHLPELVSDVAKAYEGRAAGRGVELVLELPAELPAVEADSGMLSNALGRLLDNAIKFSKKRGGRITVTGAGADISVEIAVHDNGIGIDPESMGRLFDVFSQINRAKLEQQGSGSGLAIAQGIAKLHGGAIRAESRLGEGSTFTLELPRA